MDFEKKHQEDLQRLRGFRLLDDDFMTKVFEDISCAELLLRIILNDEGIRVLEAHSQRGIKNLQGRSVKLDILAVDSHNRVFNVEVQRSDRGAGAKRARYNSALIDANVTEPGDQYEDLNETFVIFITVISSKNTARNTARMQQGSSKEAVKDTRALPFHVKQ